MMGVSAQHNKVHLAIATRAWPSYFSPELRAKGITLGTAKYPAGPRRRPRPIASKAAGLHDLHHLPSTGPSAKAARKR
jgi:branched-chain amino acid aminotransferase